MPKATLILHGEGDKPTRVISLGKIGMRAMLAALAAAAALVAVLLYSGFSDSSELKALREKSADLDQSLADRSAALLEQKMRNDELEKLTRDASDKLGRLDRMEERLRRFLGLGTAKVPSERKNQGGPDPGDPATRKALKESLFNKAMNIPETAPPATERELADALDAIEERSYELAGIPSLIPASDPGAYISGPYGLRKDPLTGGGLEFHNGIDIAGSYRSAIVAPADGKVILSRRESAMGEMIKIAHAAGIVTVFGHMAKRTVSEGDYVKRGDTIGFMGLSGRRTTGTHLHYSITVDGRYVDPTAYLWDGLANPFAAR